MTGEEKLTGEFRVSPSLLYKLRREKKKRAAAIKVYPGGGGGRRSRPMNSQAEREREKIAEEVKKRKISSSTLSLTTKPRTKPKVSLFLRPRKKRRIWKCRQERKEPPFSPHPPLFSGANWVTGVTGAEVWVANRPDVKAPWLQASPRKGGRLDLKTGGQTGRKEESHF